MPVQEQTSMDAELSTTVSPEPAMGSPPPVLEYRSPPVTKGPRPRPPVDPFTGALIISFIAFFYTMAAGRSLFLIPFEIVFVILVFGGSYFALARRRLRAVGILTSVQLGLALALFSMGFIITLIGVGASAQDASDFDFWTKDNPGYALSPRRALVNLWLSVAGGIWYLLILFGYFARRRLAARGLKKSASSTSLPCSPRPEPK